MQRQEYKLPACPSFASTPLVQLRAPAPASCSAGAWVSIRPGPGAPARAPWRPLDLLTNRFTAAALDAAHSADDATVLAAAAHLAAVEDSAASGGWQPKPSTSGSGSGSSHAPAASPAAPAPAPAAAAADDHKERGEKKGACPLGYGQIDNRLLQLKRYPLPTISHGDTFGAKNLGVTVGKNALLIGCLAYNMYLWDWLEAEETAMRQGQELGHEVEPEYPELPPVDDVLKRTALATLRDLVHTTVRKALSLKFKEELSERLAWKLLKPFKDSVQRKAYFYGNSVRLAPTYFLTVWRATFIYWSAEWIVSSASDGLKAAKWFFRGSDRGGKAALGVVQMALGGAVHHAMRCFATWTISAMLVGAVASLCPKTEWTGWTAASTQLLTDFMVPALVEHFVWGTFVAAFRPPPRQGGEGGGAEWDEGGALAPTHWNQHDG